MIKDTQILDLLEAGVKAEGVRQKAIANNIANLNTPGYRRFDIKFQEILAKMLKADGPIDSSKLEPEFFQPKTTRMDITGNDVEIDTEVGEMVKNTSLHSAYTLLIKKKYEQMKAAIQNF